MTPRLAPLFRVGGDLFLRTGLLIVFMFFATRVANRMGTGDYAYMRNGMFVATLTGSGLLLWIERSGSDNLRHVWLAAVVWIFIRALVGLIRIWPGIGGHLVWQSAKDKGKG